MAKHIGRSQQVEIHREITTLILTGGMAKMYGLPFQVGLRQLHIIVTEHIPAMRKLMYTLAYRQSL